MYISHLVTNILANSVDPGEMLLSVALRLFLHCLPKCPFRVHATLGKRSVFVVVPIEYLAIVDL